MHQNPRSLQVESTFKRARRATRTRSSLLGYLRPSSDMADGLFLLNPLSTAWMVQPTIGLCHGIPTSTSRNAPLPTLASRVQTKRNDTKSHVLKIKRNVYGQKQAGRVWNQYMDQGMKSIGYTPSKFDPCLYYRKSIVFLVCIDDCIVFGPNDKDIDEMVNDLRLSSKTFTLDDQGDVGDFLGIKIQTLEDGSIVLTQP